MSVTSATKITNFGPMLGLKFDDQRRIWLERKAVDYIRVRLVPAHAPNAPADLVGECWLWVGPMTGDDRPYCFWKDETVNIRRLLYDIKNGPLDGRRFLVAACKINRCCNPDHMDAVAKGPVPKEALTPAQAGRYDRCDHGHVLSPSNLYERDGRSYCRACRARNSRSYRSANRAKGTGTTGRRSTAPPTSG